ncbi:recombinase family protein [Streptomyces sp. CA-278952]|uniref:recombinase family protein n=1 Tax=Streptomyces sp. CA-278952 TaxID=2980556 RepID=UPI002367C430|nr:recombinase family protein [Streptomyces sp. CA-278952]WDG33274.1 recombinase family protein [Streptomyces sp. CA-278952]
MGTVRAQPGGQPVTDGLARVTTVTGVIGVDDDPSASSRLVRPRSVSATPGSPPAGRNSASQIDVLTLAGCRHVFPERKSGKNDLRPELKACHAFLQAGTPNTLVVPSLDRYGPSLQDR